MIKCQLLNISLSPYYLSYPPSKRIEEPERNDPYWQRSVPKADIALILLIGPQSDIDSAFCLGSANKLARSRELIMRIKAI